jgi:hypothetical protein
MKGRERERGGKSFIDIIYRINSRKLMGVGKVGSVRMHVTSVSEPNNWAKE